MSRSTCLKLLRVNLLSPVQGSLTPLSNREPPPSDMGTIAVDVVAPQPSSSQPPLTGSLKKPMYEDHHPSASCLIARVRNLHHLNVLSSTAQFKWLHRFYVVLDQLLEQHKVYKLFGGPHGLVVSTNVAEPDPDHAVTLFRFARHLMTSLQHILLPGGQPLDMALVLSSGELSSGLLGTTSLTYQLVGPAMAVGKELVDTQPELQLMITSEFYSLLEENEAIASSLRLVGRYSAAAAPGEVAVYTLAHCKGERLYSLSELADLQRAKQPHVVCEEPCKQEQEVVSTKCMAAVEKDNGAGKEPASCSEYERDALLSYKDAATEARYIKYQHSTESVGDALWSKLGLVFLLAYYLIVKSSGSSIRLAQVLMLHLLPLAMMFLRRAIPDLYLRVRDDASMLHRLLTMLACSLPSSFAFSGGLVMLAFGMLPVLFEVLGRRLSFRLQLASSVQLHVISLLLMGAHKPGTLGHILASPNYLLLHCAAIVLLPCAAAYAWESHSRSCFEAAERDGWKAAAEGEEAKAGATGKE